MRLPSDLIRRLFWRRKFGNICMTPKKSKCEARMLCSSKTDFSGKKDTTLSINKYCSHELFLEKDSREGSLDD